ncbi:MAG: phosphatase PAP2 family protein [Clostridia bacterium]|nr:phosphatase PAP2 family protein [Clostridia bacterium]
MKVEGKKKLILGITNISVFALWSFLIQTIDVKSVGVNGTELGFATINTWFHSVTGVNMTLYNITDWAGLVPVFICMFFGFIGLIQLIKRKSLLKVDFDIIALGIYYVIVISGYLIFEMIPINYRPVLINGLMEASYPSSTTLLVLSVMPTLAFEVNKRIKNTALKRTSNIITVIFTIFMVVGRLISGVHWLTDIIGSIFLSMGLFYIYKGTVLWNSAKNCRN